jgi:circadian clock protein KaiC
VPGLLQLLRRTIAEEKPSVIVIDGLESVEQIANDVQRAKEFLHELQGFAFLTNTTTLLCAVTQRAEARRNEDAMMDGVIELSDQLVGPRAVRELTVHKFRGSGYLRGRHETEITADGLQIHPRTEIQFDDPPACATEQRARLAFGVPGLDTMLAGGIPPGRRWPCWVRPAPARRRWASRSWSRGRSRATRASFSASTSRRRA